MGPFHIDLRPSPPLLLLARLFSLPRPFSVLRSTDAAVPLAPRSNSLAPLLSQYPHPTPSCFLNSGWLIPWQSRSPFSSQTQMMDNRIGANARTARMAVVNVRVRATALRYGVARCSSGSSGSSGVGSEAVKSRATHEGVGWWRGRVEVKGGIKGEHPVEKLQPGEKWSSTRHRFDVEATSHFSLGGQLGVG